MTKTQSRVRLNPNADPAAQALGMKNRGRKASPRKLAAILASRAKAVETRKKNHRKAEREAKA